MRIRLAPGLRKRKTFRGWVSMWKVPCLAGGWGVTEFTNDWDIPCGGVLDIVYGIDEWMKK